MCAEKTIPSELNSNKITLIIMISAIDWGERVCDSKYWLKDVMQEVAEDKSTPPLVAMCQWCASVRLVRQQLPFSIHSGTSKLLQLHHQGCTNKRIHGAQRKISKSVIRTRQSMRTVDEGNSKLYSSEPYLSELTDKGHTITNGHGRIPILCCLKEDFQIDIFMILNTWKVRTKLVYFHQIVIPFTEIPIAIAFLPPSMYFTLLNTCEIA